MKRTSLLLAVAIALGATAPAALGQVDDEPNWVMQRNSLMEVDDSTIGTNPDFEAITLIIEFRAPGTPLIMLSCQYTSNGNAYLNAGFQLEPESAPEHSGQRKLNAQSISGPITIGNKTHAARWFYQPTTTRMAPKDRAIALKLYNAAARGDLVSLKARGETYAMHLPAPNAVLGEFANWCPKTNGGTMDMKVFEDQILEAVKTSNEP